VYAGAAKYTEQIRIVVAATGGGDRTTVRPNSPIITTIVLFQSLEPRKSEIKARTRRRVACPGYRGYSPWVLLAVDVLVHVPVSEVDLDVAGTLVGLQNLFGNQAGVAKSAAAVAGRICRGKLKACVTTLLYIRPLAAS